MDFRLNGRVALITGAGRGIGLAMAQALAEHGCAVAIQDIDETVANEQAERIKQGKGRAIALPGDITDLSWPARWISRTQEELGGLHILINNASIQVEKHWLEMTVEETERQYRADLISPTLLCQLAAPIFRRQKWGRIINLGSIQQTSGNPTMLPYAASKSALENITWALARDLASANVTANVLAPGFFNTHRNRHLFKGGRPTKEIGKSIPLGHVGEPREIGGITLLLCSNEGAYITGQTIFVDGGIGIR